MKKILLLPVLMTLGIVGCSINPEKPIDFPPINTMYTTYDGPKLVLSDVKFVTKISTARGLKNYTIGNDGAFRIREQVSPPVTLTDNSNQVLQRYLEETGRFVMRKPVGNDGQAINLIKNHPAQPLIVEATLVQLQSKDQGKTHVAQVFGEPNTVAKSATVNLTLKDQSGNVLYVAEGKSTVNSSDRGVPQIEYLDDFVVDNALKNSVHEFARALDQGRIVK